MRGSMHERTRIRRTRPVIGVLVAAVALVVPLMVLLPPASGGLPVV